MSVQIKECMCKGIFVYDRLLTIFRKLTIYIRRIFFIGSDNTKIRSQLIFSDDVVFVWGGGGGGGGGGGWGGGRW